MFTKDIKTFISFSFVVLALSACTPATIVMEVDGTLKSNSTMYVLSYPDSMSDTISGKRLNISFGPYRVVDADLSWRKVNVRAGDPAPIVDIKRVERTGNTTITTSISGGPVSIFGFTRPPGKDDATTTESSKTITYKFKVGQNITWSAYCLHQSVKRTPPEGQGGNIEIVSSNFGCQYTRDGSIKEVWMLVVDTNGQITLTRDGESSVLFAHSTGGKYVTSKGVASTSFNGTAGYTWSRAQEGVNTKVAAISVREDISRVWLSKSNPASLNQVLSMANTGLLIYSWEFQD